MSTRFESKLELLNFINSSKDTLFGRLSDRLTNEEKLQKWDEIAGKAKELQIIQDHHDGRYVRDTTWQNWRKRAMAKRDNRNKTGAKGGKCAKIDESDELIYQIIGPDSPVLDGMNVPESSGSNSPSVVPPARDDSEANNNEENDENEDRRRKTPGNKTGRAHKLDLIHDLKAQRLEEQLELCKREKYMKDLGLYKMEKELGLPPSEFTQHLHQREINIVILGNSVNGGGS